MFPSPFLALITVRVQDGLCEGSSSPMLMLPTHITRLPNGKEKGMYLAIDLGGTNFRVLKVEPAPS